MHYNKKQKYVEHRINDLIKVEKIRLVGGQDLGYQDDVYDINEALSIAKELGVDLIEITQKPDISICRAMEYTKFLYEQKKKKKEIRKNQKGGELKEMRFTPNIGENDFETKVKQIIGFLKEKNKVRACVFFKGRDIIYKDKGQVILLKLLQEVATVGTPESMPQLEGKKMFVTIKPK